MCVCVLFQAVQHLLVVCTQEFYVIDHRTITTKYRVPIEYVEKISLSPYQDQLAVFHMKKVSFSMLFKVFIRQ